MKKIGLLILMMLLVVAFSNAQNNASVIHHIGEKFGGGIIFYLDETGQHGLIAAPSDLNKRYRWGCGHENVGAKSLNDGLINTNKIIERSEGKTAARKCSELVIDNFHDWYLPALAELKLIYDNKMKIEGLTTNDYWSSSEYEKGHKDSMAIHFGRDGKPFHYHRHTHFNVRAVRKF